MIFISSEGFCGEDDFRDPSLEEVRLFAEKNGAIRSKGVDMLWILTSGSREGDFHGHRV